MKLTERRKKTFLAELARHGILARAARAASPHSRSQYGALQTFVDERHRDPDFAVKWDGAMEVARADVEHELYRRAQEGWDEPIFGGKYKEQIVGTVRRYSDRLLELRVKALVPQYREAAGVKVSGTVEHQVNAGILGDAVARVAVQLAQSLLPPPIEATADVEALPHES